MSTTAITKQQLDMIVDAFKGESVDDGKISININENGFYADAAAEIDIHSYDNYITFEGRRYFEGTYDEIDGVSDVYVDAWFNNKRLTISDEDIEYLIEEISSNI